MSCARLLFLTDDLDGGTGNHMLSVMSRWNRDVVEPEIASTQSPSTRHDPPGKLIELSRPAGPAQYPVRQIMRFLQIRRCVRDRSPDLVHSYFFWMILYGRLLRATGEIPLLVENREDEGFNWGKHEYLWLRATRNVPDRIICVSESVRRIVLRREKVDPGRTVVIHNGVSPPPEVPEQTVERLRSELDIPPGSPVVGMVANLDRSVKGGRHVVDFASHILDAVPDVRFVIVGRVADREALRSRAKSAGVEDHLLLPGYRRDVEVFYELMDVSVLISSSEGLSITLLESMSHGLPVVATQVGGNPEVVQDDRTGYLVAQDEPEAFASRVAELLRDPDLRRRMGEAGRRRAETHFSLDSTAEHYMDLYRSLLQQQP